MVDTAYDAAVPPVQALCDSSALFIVAYADGNYATPLSTINAYRAAGKGIMPAHERGTGDLLGGYQAGVTAANQCMSSIAAWQCPQDGSVTIFYALDEWCDPNDYPKVGAAFDGIRATHAGRWKASLYGQGGLIDYLVANKKIDGKGWLSASTSFPGWNPDSPNVGMWQMVGSDIPGTDQNVVTDPHGLGVWYVPGHEPSGGGTPITEDDMGSIDDTPENEALVKQWTAEATFGPAGSGADLSIDVPGVTVATSIVQYLVDTRGALGDGLQSTYDKLTAQIKALSDKVDALPAGGSPAAPGPINITLTGTGTPA